MAETPNLTLPYIMAAQAQKHVTHNEAVRILDALVHLSALDRDLTAPPASPTDGSRYIVATGGTGDWAGKDGQIAAWQDNAWIFHVPREGWLCWVADEDSLVTWDGSVWAGITGGGGTETAAKFGVNTTADTTNKLAVKSDAVLLSHDDVTPGNGNIQAKLNKATAGGTASFLFQDNFSGRAEIGLTGDDDFHFKVSADGATWKEAIAIDRQSGKPSFPSGIDSPILAGAPLGGLNQSDVLYLDPLGGNDANDGITAATAIKTPAALENRLTIGRALTLFLMNDINWDYHVVSRYPINSLSIFGYNSAGTGVQQRKITVKNATNYTSLPGGISFYAPSIVYLASVNIDLDTANSYAFLLFENISAFFRTADMTISRVGTGDCVLFSNGASFAPSQHSNLVIDTTAQGYIARGVPAGTNPNNFWNYPSNVTSF